MASHVNFRRGNTGHRLWLTSGASARAVPQSNADKAGGVERDDLRGVCRRSFQRLHARNRAHELSGVPEGIGCKKLAELYADPEHQSDVVLDDGFQSARARRVGATICIYNIHLLTGKDLRLRATRRSRSPASPRLAARRAKWARSRIGYPPIMVVKNPRAPRLRPRKIWKLPEGTDSGQSLVITPCCKIAMLKRRQD